MHRHGPLFLLNHLKYFQIHEKLCISLKVYYTEFLSPNLFMIALLIFYGPGFKESNFIPVLIRETWHQNHAPSHFSIELFLSPKTPQTETNLIQIKPTSTH